MLSPKAQFKVSWIVLTIIGLSILIFGIITSLWPGRSDTLFIRSIGVASIGMGLFGTMISIIPFRGHERWSWYVLWYYPIFWLIHLMSGLPPGKDHIHQIIFITLSIFALLLAYPRIFQDQK